jgi:chloramphenicol-sensitive protein RarD
MTTHSRGLAQALGAYLIWGISPIFWKLMPQVPAGELLAHRIVWCCLLLALLITAQRRWPQVRAVFRSRRVALTLLLTTALVTSNWLVYLWAVTTDRILEASLGYYINPLVTVLLAMVFLGERPARLLWWALGLAAIGVAILTAGVGTMPWLSLLLAFSFGFYGLLRKRVGAGAEVGLLVETAIASPLALLFLLSTTAAGGGRFGAGEVSTDLLLMASGLITAAPLLLFNLGVRQLPLATVGFLQYLAPTLQFLLAVLVYREPFGRTQLAAFALIWAALVLFTLDLRRRRRSVTGTLAAEPVGAGAGAGAGTGASGAAAADRSTSTAAAS